MVGARFMATTESMRIFRDACNVLAGRLTTHGFTYRKSKREASRRGPRFEHSVTFATSRSVNSLPGHVHLEVRATAWSEALADYRRKAGIELPINEAVLFSTTVENIFRPAPPYVRYDVGDPGMRGAVLTHIARVLENEVLRAFDLIESSNALREAVDAGAIPCLEEDGVRDYLACFGPAQVGKPPAQCGE
jgi:hypothetical protein